MDINRVRYFHVFCEAGSLVRASEILLISQPALSKALKLLETESGMKLLEAEGRGLRLSKAGEIFKQQTAPLLKQWLELPSKLHGEASAAPTRIGSFEVFTTYFLNRLMQYVTLENLEVHEFSPGNLEKAIVEKIVDFGITYSPIPKAGVEFIELTKVRMGVFGVLKKYKDYKFTDLPFAIPLMPTEGTPSKVMGLDGWPDHKIARKVKFRVTLMESAMELCRRGHAVAYLPDFVVQLYNETSKSEFQLAEIPSPVNKKESLQSVFLVRPQQGLESSLERQVAKALRQLR